MNYLNKWSIMGTILVGIATFIYGVMTFVRFVEYPIGIQKEWLTISIVTLAVILFFHIIYGLVFLFYLRKK